MIHVLAVAWVWRNVAVVGPVGVLISGGQEPIRFNLFRSKQLSPKGPCNGISSNS